jgi:lactoylglutathione lyase
MGKTLLPAYRVSDLDASVAFYQLLGYGVVGRVRFGDDESLTVLKFPDEEVATLELVYRPADGPIELGTGFSHLAVQLDDLVETMEKLTQAGLEPGPVQHPEGPQAPQTSWISDPDGYRIELVQWPPGHADGVTEADFEGDPRAD